MNIQQIKQSVDKINKNYDYNKKMGYYTTFYDNNNGVLVPTDYSEVYDKNDFPIKGANNGQSGFGMTRGAVFPSNMNGPFGYVQKPLPINLSLPAVLNNSLNDFKYNARGYNGPDYNQQAFRGIMGNSAGTVEFNPKYSFINGNSLLLSDFSLRK